MEKRMLSLYGDESPKENAGKCCKVGLAGPLTVIAGALFAGLYGYFIAGPEAKANLDQIENPKTEVIVQGQASIRVPAPAPE
jgi:hypothetical protein